MKIEFYGVRGSVPAPGPATQKYGGNTSCVHIKSDGGAHIILDAGTGIIGLGNSLLSAKEDLHILLTHNHWDHIQGFPYFKPIYQSDRKITIYPGQIDNGDGDAILTQMSGSTFPVCYEDLPCDLTLDSHKTTLSQFDVQDVRIRTKALNHPGGGTAYLLENKGKKVAYITDNELEPPTDLRTTKAEWAQFFYGVDLLIHDAQFIEEDLPHKLGWGHSTVGQVVKLGIEANAKKLALISHDPARTDSELDLIQKDLQEHFQNDIEVICASEGLSFEF